MTAATKAQIGRFLGIMKVNLQLEAMGASQKSITDETAALVARQLYAAIKDDPEFSDDNR